MAKRIKDITRTATSLASDDYFVIDGSTNGTRKILNEYTKACLSVTYSELLALISSNSLIAGRWYKITDYQTIYYDGTRSEIVTSTTIEPLLVFAVENNKLANQAFSTLHPEDIIYYDINGTAVSFLTGCTKGVIYRRIDTKRNIDIPIDWRYIKFYVYKMADPEDLSELVQCANGNESDYSVATVALKNSTNELYVRINSGSLELFTNDFYWQRLPFDANHYISFNPSDLDIPLSFSSILVADFFDSDADLRPVFVSSVESSYTDYTNSGSIYNIKIEKLASPIQFVGYSHDVDIKYHLNNYVIGYIRFSNIKNVNNCYAQSIYRSNIEETLTVLTKTISNSNIGIINGIISNQIINSDIKQIEGIIGMIVDSNIVQIMGILVEISESNIKSISQSVSPLYIIRGSNFQEITDCIFSSSVLIDNVNCKVTELDGLTLTNAEFSTQTSKEIIMRPDTAVYLTYYNNSNVLQFVAL